MSFGDDLVLIPGNFFAGFSALSSSVSFCFLFFFPFLFAVDSLNFFFVANVFFPLWLLFESVAAEI